MRAKDVVSVNELITDLNNHYLYEVDAPGRFWIAPFELKNEQEAFSHRDKKWSLTIYDKYFKTATELQVVFDIEHNEKHSDGGTFKINTDLQEVVEAFVKSRI